MSESARCDFVIDQNADFFVEIYWTDYANSPIAAVSPMRMEIRSKTGQLAAELLYTGDLPEESVPPTITFNAESGLIQLQLPKEKTNAMAPGLYDYDLYVSYMDAQSNSTLRRHRLLYGAVEVRKKVTQNV